MQLTTSDTVIASYDLGNITREQVAHEASRFPRLTNEAQLIEAYAAVRWMAHKAKQSGIANRNDIACAMKQTRLTLLEEAYCARLKDAQSPDPNEVEVVAQRLKSRHDDAEKRKLRMIFKKVDRESDSQLRHDELLTLRARALEGVAFSELASHHSDSSNRHVGGLVGTIDLNRLPDPIRNAANLLGEGAISMPIRVQQGWVILQCERILPGLSMADLESQARDKVRQKMALVALDRDRQDILEKANINLNGAPNEQLAVAEKTHLFRSDFSCIVSGHQNLSLETVHASLVTHVRAARQVANGVSAQLASQIEFSEDMILANAYFEGIRSSMATLYPDEVVAEFIENHPEYFIHPELVDLKVIMMKSQSDITSIDIFSSLVSLRTHVLNGEISFEDAARQFSSLPNAPHGGDTGTIGMDQVARWGPIVYHAVEHLSECQTSEVLQDKLEFWLIRMEHKYPSRPMTQVESEIKCRDLFKKRDGLTLLDQTRRKMAQECHLQILSRPD